MSNTELWPRVPRLENGLRNPTISSPTSPARHLKPTNSFGGLRREAGFIPEELQGPEAREVLPDLNPRTNFLALMKQHGFIRDPGQYVKDLAALIPDAGGRVVRAEVRDFDLSGGRINSVDTNRGRFECDAAVISAGVWSREISRKLDLSVPMETERGYHIIFEEPSIELPCPVMVASGKFVATPMTNGLRCAGVLEFGGLVPGMSSAPLKLIRKKAVEAFPKLKWAAEKHWLGHRPAPSDSLPLIGEVGSTGVFAAFGHHHVGLTAGPKTGKIIAELIAKGETRLDLTPYRPLRFKNGWK